MLQINFQTKTNDPFDEIIKDVKAFDAEIKQEINDLGPATALMMLSIIAASKVRPQNGEPLDLENHIKCEFFEGGWGVGDVEDLKESAPYWAAINWGSSHMVGKRVPQGSFSASDTTGNVKGGKSKDVGSTKPDQAFFRTGRWVTDKGNFSFIVKRPIPPMNYIEKTLFWLSDVVNHLNIK